MARTITLVLLGGGVALGGAAMLAGTTSPSPRDRQRPCEEAQASQRPDAEQICASARSSAHYHGVGPWVWIGSGRAARRGPALADANGFRAPAASSRGGFGATARGFFSSSGS